MNLLDTIETFKIQLTRDELEKIKHALINLRCHLKNQDEFFESYYYLEVNKLHDEVLQILDRKDIIG